jgi:sulfotransferase family protein
MSTSLQRDLFAVHPEIMFLGWGRSDTEHGWISDELSILCEVGIRYEKVLDFNKNKAGQIFNKLLSDFEGSEKKRALCLSYESFSFTMHFDVDPVIKAGRLRNLMGRDAKILIVIRNQLDLIRSYYYECVRGGYPGRFSDFFDFNYHYQFHSIFSDLCYSKLYNHYCKLFGRENVLILPMEAIIESPRKAISKICKHAGVSNVDYPLRRHNSSTDKRYIQAVRWLNEKFPNNMGATYFGWVDGEKLATYWRDNLNTNIPKAATRNYNSRMLVYRSAKEVVANFAGDLLADYPPNWIKRLSSLYQDDNRLLEKISGLDLEQFGYIF